MAPIFDSENLRVTKMILLRQSIKDTLEEMRQLAEDSADMHRVQNEAYFYTPKQNFYSILSDQEQVDLLNGINGAGSYKRFQWISSSDDC